MPTDAARSGDEPLSFARPSRPTGLRKLSPAHLAVRRLAEGFAGLPAEVRHPLQLLAAVKAAAAALGIPGRVVQALDALFRFTQPQDWERGSRPLVWPSLRLQQHDLGVGPTQVKLLNRQLVEFGLVAVRDSPTGRRWGRRDGEGRIVEAYGFDLSPLALRHGEFVAAASADRAERAALARLRRRATIARKGIVQLLETAAEHRLIGAESGFDFAELQEAARAIGAALSRAERAEEWEAGVAALERRWQDAANWLNSRLNEPETDRSGPEYRPFKQTTKPPFQPMATVMAHQSCSPAGGAGLESQDAGDAGGRGSPEIRVRPEEVVALAPKLGRHVRGARPGWREVVDAADGVREELGISRSLWGRACRVMGRERAAVALAIVSAKPEGHFRSSAGGYFHAMVARDEAGTLYLERTIFGLRQQRQPS